MSEPSHDEVLEFVLANRKPFAKTTDVAERFSDVSKRTIQSRLNDLVERGELKKDNVGAKAVVWYPPVQRSEDARRATPSSDSQ
jgi:DeoR/GlpR family transcriptional regulator of sugar metabolism